MRVVLFASGGPLSLAALGALHEGAEVVGVVIPRERGAWTPRAMVRRIMLARARAPLLRTARLLDVPLVTSARGRDAELEEAVGALAPHLLVVASFPRLLSPSLLAVPRFGALGLHASRLPRHRGPVPLFWTYFQDDTEAGLTLFWLDAGEDTGAILAAGSVPLPRGLPIDDLYSMLAEKGAALLRHALPEIGAGTAPRVPQDESVATREPAPRPGRWRIDHESWDAERVWHVLSGLGGRHRLLVDENGRPVAHGRATRYRLEAHGRRPGSIEPVDGGWLVYCRDGVVEVAGLRRLARWRECLRSRP